MCVSVSRLRITNKLREMKPSPTAFHGTYYWYY